MFSRIVLKSFSSILIVSKASHLNTITAFFRSVLNLKKIIINMAQTAKNAKSNIAILANSLSLKGITKVFRKSGSRMIAIMNTEITTVK